MHRKKENKKKTEEFRCGECGKEYKHASGLSRHKKECTNGTIWNKWEMSHITREEIEGYVTSCDMYGLLEKVYKNEGNLKVKIENENVKVRNKGRWNKMKKETVIRILGMQAYDVLDEHYDMTKDKREYEMRVHEFYNRMKPMPEIDGDRVEQTIREALNQT
jgi:hypothetical protein